MTMTALSQFLQLAITPSPRKQLDSLLFMRRGKATEEAFDLSIHGTARAIRTLTRLLFNISVFKLFYVSHSSSR